MYFHRKDGIDIKILTFKQTDVCSRLGPEQCKVSHATVEKVMGYHLDGPKARNQFGHLMMKIVSLRLETSEERNLYHSLITIPT